MNRLCKRLAVLRAAVAAASFVAGLSAAWAQVARVPQAPGANPGAPDLERGKVVATQVCALCHGADGNSPVSVYPKLAGQHADYLVKQLKDFRPQPGGKPPARNSAIMAGFASALSGQDMVDVAAWFASQPLKSGDAAGAAATTSGQTIWRFGVAGRGVPACAACHGPTGQGIPVQYPRLAGQWADYVVAQLKDFQQGTRDNSEPMRDIAQRLSDDEIKAVAGYVAGLH
ncbi:cytochrome c4 [Burkholderia sp. WAC0059]|uniref:c-type cytochrome n=1 Tax=Burkholderia sp. WAC0059 TaxID=2066022 RepID=UPI000C7EA0AE|nr:c-type cytochrome [Burkholderia sp. WAC0059]PLZ01334.1 cytochrome c4 [Burkholderia sp. WAC0059]